MNGSRYANSVVTQEGLEPRRKGVQNCCQIICSPVFCIENSGHWADMRRDLQNRFESARVVQVDCYLLRLTL